MMPTHLPFLFLLLLSVSSTSSAWNVSIDCGTTGSYIDSNSIKWIGDASLIENGEIYELKDNQYNVNRPLQSLRAFTVGNRNCYTINATKGDQVLVRATFNYGNYDGKFSGPVFELQLDGNFWVKVETEDNKTVSYEAIYFVKRDTMSVCLAQTEVDQFPFISALEVRSLGEGMYDRPNKNSALFMVYRIAFGITEIIRHPYDTYDRIWRPTITLGFSILTRKELPNVANAMDYPPKEVFQGALISRQSYLFLTFSNLPADEVPIYLNMYFADVDPKAVPNRSFSIQKGDTWIYPEAIVPSYDNATQVTISNVTASATTPIAIVNTSYSQFPPLINAVEIFVVGDVMTDGTSSTDVEGLSALTSEFKVLRRWSGDPCLPSNYKWDWVNCSTDIPPRIIALNLSGFGLSGPLPDFSSMDALQYIDLQSNNLNGTIPDFLGNFPNLIELNLADNNFSGSVPSSLSSNTHINLKTTGNENLCVSESCKASVSNLPTTTSFATLILSCITSWVLCWM